MFDVALVVISFSVCFVFKQKTAYEMRISDWSSDVCSSDLVGDDGGRGGARARARALEEEAADEIALGNDGVQRAGNIGERMVGGDEARQIGRDACRERGCQYA